MTNSKKASGTRASVTATQPAVGGKAKAATRTAAGTTLTKSTARTPVKTAPKPAAEPGAAAAQIAAKAKHRLVRDSFTIPKSEYTVLEGLKLRAANLARPVKKSELLRAGIAVLHAMTDKAFLAALNEVPSLKTGRPKGANGASAAAMIAT
jgi:hypothetical protein